MERLSNHLCVIILGQEADRVTHAGVCKSHQDIGICHEALGEGALIVLQAGLLGDTGGYAVNEFVEFHGFVSFQIICFPLTVSSS